MSKYIIGCLISASIAIAYALAAGHNSRTYAGIPSFYIIVAIIHLIQIIAFIPAKIFNTEMFYDLTGSITYQLVITFCLLSSDYLTNKQIIAASLVVIWALRLGSFLFYRILKSGHDSRFFTIKKSAIRFFMSWFIQGLWVTLTAGPVYSFLTEK
jgi:steroid 5-alpha reductase family enzyme